MNKKIIISIMLFLVIINIFPRNISAASYVYLGGYRFEITTNTTTQLNLKTNVVKGTNMTISWYKPSNKMTLRVNKYSKTLFGYSTTVASYKNYELYSNNLSRTYLSGYLKNLQTGVTTKVNTSLTMVKAQMVDVVYSLADLFNKVNWDMLISDIYFVTKTVVVVVMALVTFQVLTNTDMFDLTESLTKSTEAKPLAGQFYVAVLMLVPTGTSLYIAKFKPISLAAAAAYLKTAGILGISGAVGPANIYSSMSLDAAAACGLASPVGAISGAEISTPNTSITWQTPGYIRYYWHFHPMKTIANYFISSNRMPNHCFYGDGKF